MLIAFNNTNSSNISFAVWNSTALTFQTIYYNATSHINGWNLRSNDRFIIGNFDNTNSRDELMIINPSNGWAYLSRFNSSAFVDLWMNGGSGSLPGWILRTTDRYIAADVDGDETDELICLSPYN